MRRGHVRSSSQHLFSRAPSVRIHRSRFDRSFGVKTTFDAGYLVPVLVDEMLPGDTFHLKMHAFARLTTPIVPIMDNLYLETFFFAVPIRLVWSNWERFNGAQTDPGDSTDYLIPTVQAPFAGVATGELADYMGIPTKVGQITYNTLPFRCVNKIWNDWFRHEDLQDSLPVPMGDGPDTYTDYVLQRRGKRFDYFTSCLPFPQKGPDVALPLGTAAPIVGTGGSTYIYSDLYPVNREMIIAESITSTPHAVYANTGASSNGNSSLKFGESVGLQADLTDATAATVNDVRLAFQTQKLYERDARGGTRYTEIVSSHFGVVSPDARLQRSEYLGGGSSPVLVSPIAQTSATSGSNALGDLAAYGTCAPKGHGFTFSATEHMYIIGFVCVRADLNYQQGLNRMWTRQTRLDFYWPTFAHLGEQAVLNKEIYMEGGVDDDAVFGYQERYAEYRYKPSMITGLFRSNATGSLDYWHLAQDFATYPALNEEFIVEDPPMSRVLAVPSQPHFKLDAEFSYSCTRPMPLYSIPGFMDHF